MNKESMLNKLAKQRIIYPARKMGLLAASRWPYPVLSTLSDGGRMYVDLRSSIGRAILVKGEFDQQVWKEIDVSLNPGGVFLDIGANVGYYSMLASNRIGSTGVVYAFEIDPRPLRCLRKNAAMCQNQNITLNKVAVGDHVGPGILVSEVDCGHSSVKSEGQGGKVDMLTLDHWLETSVEPDHIDVIKLDIEGGELNALEGGRNLIERYRPKIVCEALHEGIREGVPGQDKLLTFFTDVNYSTRFALGVHSPTIVATPN